MFIPLFNLAWHFILVQDISASLHNKFEARGIAADVNAAKNIGLSMCILNIIAIVPYLGYLAAVGGVVCWILYWIKIHEFSKKLAM